MLQSAIDCLLQLVTDEKKRQEGWERVDNK